MFVSVTLLVTFRQQSSLRLIEPDVEKSFQRVLDSSSRHFTFREINVSKSKEMMSGSNSFFVRNQ
jgi:hypothetical protein